MSNWTHVAAIARIDGWPGEYKDFEKIFGKPLSYCDPSSKWEEAEKHPERFLPMGSEGSLSMSVWVNPNKNCLATYTVSIFGDLRDHYSPQEIVDWFVDKLCKGDVTVRNACIIAENEWCGSASWNSSGLGDDPDAE